MPRDMKPNCVKIVVQNPTKSGNGTRGFLTGTPDTGEIQVKGNLFHRVESNLSPFRSTLQLLLRFEVNFIINIFTINVS